MLVPFYTKTYHLANFKFADFIWRLLNNETAMVMAKQVVSKNLATNISKFPYIASTSNTENSLNLPWNTSRKMRIIALVLFVILLKK